MNSRIFRVGESGGTRIATTLSGVTLSGGNASDGDRGGAVRADDADLHLRNVIVEQSRRAIRTNDTNLKLTDSIVRDNSFNTIWVSASDPPTNGPGYRVDILKSMISGNTGLFGAIRVFDQDITIRESVIENNSGEDGGGIYVRGVSSSLVIDSSTIANNTASGEGGGVMVWAADLEVRNSTVSGNVSASGGGLCAIYGDTRIINSTISGNIGTNLGAAFAGDGGNLDILGSTIIGNVSDEGGAAGFFAQGATIDSSVLSGNGEYDFDGASLVVTDSILGGVGLVDISGFNFSIGIDPMLGPLADNGGGMLTHAVLPGSPLIDGGPTQYSSRFDPYPVADQRGGGFVRLYGEAMDIGAVELQPDALDIDINDDGVVDVADLDALTAAVLAFDHSIDVNGDGRIHRTDRDAWLVEAGALLHPEGKTFSLGDANLDGFVDGEDFLIWNTNKFTATTAWSAGNFDLDGTVDGADFLLWNTNKTLTTVNRGLASDGANSEESHVRRSSRMIDLVFAAPNAELFG